MPSPPSRTAGVRRRRGGGAQRPVLAALLLSAVLAAGCSPTPPREGADLDPDATAVPITPAGATTAPAAPSPAPPASESPGAAATPTPPEAPPPPPATAEMAAPAPLGVFDEALAPEVSGLVASRRDPDLLWLLDDGPGTTSVVAIRTSGELVTRVEMEGVEGRDTEDLAAGPCAADDPTPCLYVGDIGDNDARRERVLVHRFPEPASDATSTAVTTASFTHPGGPVDAEALLVGADGLPVILTKEPDAARVMAATAFADGVLAEVGSLPIPAPETALLTLFTGLTVTAADARPDGQAVLLRTYDHVVELTPPTPGAPLATMASWTGVQLPAAAEAQGEAIAYLHGSASYVTASEGSGTLSVVRR